jgi:hypothetical protein
MEATDLPPLIGAYDDKMPEYAEIHFIEIHYLRLCVQQLMSDVRLNMHNAPIQPRYNDYNHTMQHMDILNYNNKYYEKISALQNCINKFMTKHEMCKNQILLGIIDDLRVINTTMGKDTYLKYGIARETSQGSQTACVADASPLENPNHPFQLASTNNQESAYSTPGRTTVMRAISQSVDVSYDEDATTYDINESYFGEINNHACLNTVTYPTANIYTPPPILKRSKPYLMEDDYNIE